MKASKFTDAQKAFVIKQGEEGTPVAEVCRKAGISQATNFNWKKKYTGLMPSEMRRLRELEDENGRLKKIVADLTLDDFLTAQFAFSWRLGIAKVGEAARRVFLEPNLQSPQARRPTEEDLEFGGKPVRANLRCLALGIHQFEKVRLGDLIDGLFAKLRLDFASIDLQFVDDRPRSVHALCPRSPPFARRLNIDGMGASHRHPGTLIGSTLFLPRIDACFNALIKCVRPLSRIRDRVRGERAQGRFDDLVASDDAPVIFPFFLPTRQQFDAQARRKRVEKTSNSQHIDGCRVKSLLFRHKPTP